MVKRALGNSGGGDEEFIDATSANGGKNADGVSSGNGSVAEFDPKEFDAIATDHNDNGNIVGSEAAGGEQKTGRKGRGRPKGSGKTKAEKTFHLESFSALLLSSHAMLAGIVKCPEMEITEDESKRLSQAANNVAKHYNLGLTEKQTDWCQLFMCLGTVYGTRIYMIHTRKKEENKQALNVVRHTGGF